MGNRESSRRTGTERTDSRAARRVVVKIGSAVLAPGGTLDEAVVHRLAADIASARGMGVQIIVVSSGAIASGFRALGLSSRPRTIVQKQAAAAVGQLRLMRAWSGAFEPHGMTVAQVLLTGDDLDHRERHLNARRTLLELLDRAVIPVINENDSVSFEEIKVGDNDRLAASVAGLVDADALIMLSSVPGLLDASGEVVRTVANPVAADGLIHAGTSGVGTGGMRTKLEAAHAAALCGADAWIAGGAEAGVVGRILAGEAVGTRMPAASRVRRSRARWIGYASRVRGTLVVDAGAMRAILEKGASLLPSGIVSVQGEFDAGATVAVAAEGGAAFARGLTVYGSADLTRIRGRRTDEIESILGVCYRDEVVHRDDLVVMPTGKGDGA